jgi:uncharacterized protein (UPF0264 family)
VTRLLVSVRSAEEATLAVGCGVSLVDAKEPLAGALGALDPAIAQAIVGTVGGRALTSAVAGDGASPKAVQAMAATGVDFVKVGVEPSLRSGDELRALAQAAAPVPLVAVLAAEDGAADRHVGRLAQAGFGGAMIDTREKHGIGLRGLLAAHELAAFVQACRGEGLLCGLAGSLVAADISGLAALGPDYLGFRGGVCIGGSRTGRLDPGRIHAARQALALAAGVAA